MSFDGMSFDGMSFDGMSRWTEVTLLNIGIPAGYGKKAGQIDGEKVPICNKLKKSIYLSYDHANSKSNG